MTKGTGWRRKSGKTLFSAVANATYVLSKVENSLITASGEILQQSIVEKVNASPYFLVLADEMADVSNTEQVCVCIR